MRCLAALVLLVPAAFAQSPVERISLGSTGQPPNGPSYTLGLSADARYVLFLSEATNLVPGDTNALLDLFLRDRQLGTTTRINVSSSGMQATGSTDQGSLSADGRFACYMSNASNLVPGDTNATSDVFLYDILAGTTERVSLDSSGTEYSGGGSFPSLSADARYALFLARTTIYGGNPSFSVAVRRDRQTGQSVVVDWLPPGYLRQGSSSHPAMSADGRFILFEATVNAVGASAFRERVFVRDMQANSVSEVSVSSLGVPADANSLWPQIAPDGSTVAFFSLASNLVSGFSPDSFGAVYVHDLQSGATELVSTDSLGQPSFGAGVIPRGVSSGGRFVVLLSDSPMLVPGDTNGQWDVFVKDRFTNATRRASVAPNGAQLPHGGWCGWSGVLTPGGRYLPIHTDSALVAGDTNSFEDTYLVDFLPARPQVYCSALPNSQGCTPQISGTGTASASSAQPFTIQCVNLLNQRPARLCYSVSPARNPFQGGLLCLGAPLTRLPAQSAGGSTSGLDCSGIFSSDFNAHIQSGLDPRLVPGTLVCAQVFARDPLAPGGYSLSAGLAVAVQP